MKLRNKKTGEIDYLLFNSYPVSGDIALEYMDENAESGYSEYCRYKTLAELNEEWEDASAEPLIKDEKVRKAVKAWAEANNIGRLSYYKSSHFWYLRSFNDHEQAIDFWLSYNAEPNLIENKCYSIDELCGEEN